MARVPVYSDLQVAPSNVPQISYGRQENLYSGIGQGLQQAGESMQRIAEIQKREKEESDRTVGLLAFNKYREETQKLNQEHALLQGMNAVEKEPEFRRKQQEVKNKYRETLANNKKALDYFDVNAIDVDGNSDSFFTAHSTKENEKVKDVVEKDAEDGLIRLAADNAINNPQASQDSFNKAMAIRKATISRTTGNPDTDPNAKALFEAVVSEKKSNLHASVVDTLIGRQQYQAAQKYFDENASNIRYEDREKLNQMFAQIKDTDRYRSEGNAKYAELQKTYGNDFGKILDGMTEYTVGMKDSRQAEYVMTLARQRISDAKIAQSDAELRTLQGLEQKLAATNGYPDDSFWKSPEFIAAPYNIQQEIRRRQESSSYTINDTVLLNDLESDMSKAQTLGDWRAIDAKLATNATKLRPDTFKAFAARSSSMKASVTNQDPGPDAKDLDMLHRVLEQTPLTNGKKVSEYIKTGDAAYKKILNWEVGFINWRASNKGKQLTIADTATFIHNNNISVPISSSSRLMNESAVNVTKLELSIWQQNPYAMPNDIKLPNLVGMSSADVRQQAMSVGAALVNRPEERPAYQAQVNMVFSQKEQDRMWTEASNDKKRMISHDEFLSYAMMEYAKKKDAVDQAKPNDLMMQFLRTARTQ